MKNKPRIRRSILIPVVFLVYSVICYCLLIPQNVELTLPKILLTFLVNLIVVLLLYVVLRKQEKLREEREEDLENASKEKEDPNA